MFKVECVGFEDLTEEQQADQPDNGHGKELASYIVIKDDGDTIMILSDAMQPEDATFNRDLNDVETAIKIAYNLGKYHAEMPQQEMRKDG